MSSKRTFMSKRHKVKRPPKPVYTVCRGYVDFLTVTGTLVSLYEVTFGKKGTIKGGSISFRVLTNSPAALVVTLPDGRSWVSRIDQDENSLHLDCQVGKGTKLKLELTGQHEIKDAFISYKFAEEVK